MGPDLERQLRERNMKTAGSLSVADLISVLESKEEVFAMQVWQEQDVINALREAGIKNPTSEQIRKIIEAKKRVLSDNSDGMECLMAMAYRIAETEPNARKGGE